MAYYGAPGSGYAAPAAYGVAMTAGGYAAAPPTAASYGAGYAAAAAPAATVVIRFNPYVPGFTPMNPTCWSLFQAVDTDRSGQISERELHMALSNGGWTKFSPRTTKLLIKMFDVSHSGQLDYKEFEQLWTQLSSWRAWFDSADRDRSGKLNLHEVTACVKHFGFNIPDHAFYLVFRAFDADNSGQLGFDEFIQLLAELNALTTVFRRYDPEQRGVATFDYGTFMTTVFMTRS